MSVSSDMIAMWHKPMVTIRRQFAAGPHEGRALALLLSGCFLVFVGRLPILQRGAIMAGEGGDLFRDVSYAFAGMVLIAPLLFYGIAALAGLLARLFRLRPTGFGARLAMFWAYLSAAPAGLLYGLALGFNGPSIAVSIVGAIWLFAFLIFWTLGLRVAGQETSHA